MNEPFSFGALGRQRFSIQFGYDMRPSFWQGLQSNAHLVIAAVGTVALLGVAAVALWLALPANDRQAVAGAAQAVPAVSVKTTKITPVVANADVSVAAAPQAARKADAVSPAIAKREASIPALAPNDPRWTAPGADTVPASAEAAPAPAANPPARQADKPAVAAYAEPAAGNDASSALSEVAAPAPTDDTPAAIGQKAEDKMDGAQTAAIPAAKPQAPDDQSAATEDQGKPNPEKASAAANGRILRAVTMRAGPKQKAAAILTVPAKTSVQVISCKKWCEIVYNGKRGWVYKTYVKNGG
ncbi:SH3 domain-containing protein [Mesorhizobium sp. M1C.F.Ca.ET.193.01.1.1]|uniref:SH3 domain-containing protein n=1 Tax=unclassified Mesorhizobium TaxID=325217 RepID=UPI000FD4A6B9|nr:MULTISPECIES: SH3 domain-containing protein [unclassified Mesorhizobium]TGT02387.1 SH3 domain-containing protein [bacterium M00.F.Ca.ET.177.01.1.1]RWK24856.1 MAG: SH3 domain-containing protein [Mesorhizobium sp.]RWK34844.1 MAG: SH3 domain-containing protein [Mesorhizobium sp.]TGQ55072.1 SH3 domain-containing protein [Mesorhizobium sp. M1C.F.Ca.ET.210.01.1.1]TGQ73717.1 SH3 domain-containing protein [Mesorhizobium sp. M1C.F.Ca.ET.212.01.1.1]